MNIDQIVSMLLAGLAGGALFIMFLNRVLGRIPDNRYKLPTIAASFIILTGGGVLAGWYAYQFPWPLISSGMLLLVALGELREIIIRHRSAGSPPLDTYPHTFELINPLTTTDLEIHRYRIELDNWQGPPVRIVQLTDMHVNDSIPLAYYRKVMQAAEAEQADLAFFTGDFVNRAEALPQLARFLKPLGRLGSFAVLGNHDYWADAAAVRHTITKHGIEVLSNTTEVLGYGRNRIAISGYDYPWGTRERTPPSHDDANLKITLSHSPDNIYRIAKSGADIAFCGHHHAGQFRIPLLGAVVVPSTYGRRFTHGHFVVDGTHLFIPAGIGAANPPLRIYCCPDIFTVEVGGKNPTPAGINPKSVS